MNLIPLNPTNGYAGGPSQREVRVSSLTKYVIRDSMHGPLVPKTPDHEAVAKFVETLRQFGVEAGPHVEVCLGK